MLRLLLRKGLWNGLVGGNRMWMVLGGAAATVRLIKRLGGGEPKVVFREELQPGQTLVISHPHRDS